jgi:hypothetical protein
VGARCGAPGCGEERPGSGTEDDEQDRERPEDGAQHVGMLHGEDLWLSLQRPYARNSDTASVADAIRWQ